MEFELKIPLIKEDEPASAILLVNFLLFNRVLVVLERIPKKNKEDKVFKFPKELNMNKQIHPLKEDEEVKFVSFLLKRKKSPYKAIMYVTLGKTFMLVGLILL